HLGAPFVRAVGVRGGGVRGGSGGVDAGDGAGDPVQPGRGVGGAGGAVEAGRRDRGDGEHDHCRGGAGGRELGDGGRGGGLLRVASPVACGGGGDVVAAA